MPITLITGGNKGLGREAARRLLALGHTVYIGARDPGRGQAAADELGAHFLPLDVTDDAAVEAAAAALTAREGRLDVLVNNAGIAGQPSPYEAPPGWALRVAGERGAFCLSFSRRVLALPAVGGSATRAATVRPGVRRPPRGTASPATRAAPPAGRRGAPPAA